MKSNFKKNLKIFTIAAASVMLVCFCLLVGINIYMISKTDSHINTDTNRNSDCILVLGCRVKADGTPSDMLRDRLDTAISLYKSGASDRIIMSGDHGRAEYDEVNAMKQYAIDNGVPSEVIFMDHAGFSTYESMYRLKNVFLADSAIVVTQEYHLPRAVYIAQTLGIEATGQGADLHTYRGQVKNDIRESAARVKDFFVSIIQPKSTYVGNPISLSGNGDITNDK